MHELESDFQTLINQFFRSRFSSVSMHGDVWHPATDIFETAKGTVVRLELAGVNPKDIQILLDGSKLIVQGIRADHNDNEKLSYQQMEITYGSFRSIFVLPYSVQTSEIRSSYKDGFLEIILPHSQKALNGIVVVNIEEH